jgi:hypothetical protein
MRTAPEAIVALGRRAVVGRGRVKTENRKVLKGRFTIADTRRSRCRPFSQAGFDSARMKRTF